MKKIAVFRKSRTKLTLIGPLLTLNVRTKKRIDILPFNEESTGYEKTILSDLQGAWSLLRDSIVDAAGLEGWDRAMFHIDEAMSWESARNLKRMPPLLLIIRNLCVQGKVPQEILENIQECWAM